MFEKIKNIIKKIFDKKSWWTFFIIFILFITFFNVNIISAYYNEYKDPVDNKTSNVDSSANLGSFFNFVNCQETSPDTDYFSMTENNTGTGAINEDLYIDGFSSNGVAWDEYGDSPYLDGNDYPENYIGVTQANGQDEYWFSFGDTSNTGSGFSVIIYTDVSSGDTDDDLKWYVDTTGDNTAEFSGTINNPSSGGGNTGVISGLDTQTEINACRVWLEAIQGGMLRASMTIDYVYMNIQKDAVVEYDLDMEFQFTGLYTNRTNRTLCMYITLFTVAENFPIQVWNNSAWLTINTITTTGWFNGTIWNTSSSTITIRIIDSSLDTTATNCRIDCMFMFCFNDIMYPVTPSSFNVVSVSGSVSSVYATWNKETYADYTRIQYKLNSYPTSISDGTNCYNNTGSSTTIDSLTEGKLYYFKAWGYNVTFNTWSLTNSTDTCQTNSYPDKPNNVYLGYNKDIVNILTWSFGTNATVVRIQFSNATQPLTISSGTNLYNSTDNVKYHIVDNDLIYYYSLWSWDNNSKLWSDEYVIINITTNCSSGTGECPDNYLIYLYENIINVTGTLEYNINESGYQVYANYTGNNTGNTTGNYTEDDLFLTVFSVITFSGIGVLMMRRRKSNEK